jgi:hypothetical protein
MIDASKLIGGQWYWVKDDQGERPMIFSDNRFKPESSFFFLGHDRVDLVAITESPRGPITRDALPIVGDDRIATAEFVASLPGAQRIDEENIFRVGQLTFDCMWSEGRISIEHHTPIAMTERQIKQLLALFGARLPS